MPNEILGYAGENTLELVLRRYLRENDIDAEIYFNRRPQASALPCIVVEKLSEDRAQYVEGVVRTADYRFSLLVMSERYEQMLDVSNRLKTLLHGFTGFWSDKPIYYVNLDAETDEPQDPTDGSDLYLHARDCQYLIKAAD